MTVVIVDPPLNLSLFDRQAPERFTSVAPGVETWLVGGHSMGGVRACELAEEAGALKLFASYCAADISTSEKIAEHRDALPGGAEMVEIAGGEPCEFRGPLAAEQRRHADHRRRRDGRRGRGRRRGAPPLDALTSAHALSGQGSSISAWTGAWSEG